MARSEREPQAIGLTTGESLSAAVLGALRLHYDGRPARLLTDLRLALADADPVTRLNAGLTLLALREIAAAIQRIPSGSIEAIIDDLPDSEWNRIADRQASRRKPPD